MIRVVSWNMAHRSGAWDTLRDLEADVALLQEAGKPEPAWAGTVSADPNDRWETLLHGGRGTWRTAVVRLSERVELRPRSSVTLEATTSYDDWVVSRPGSIAAADVVENGELAFTAVSVYAAWEKVGGQGWADASAHRILSDLCALMESRKHRLIVAGDWNLLRGYGEHGDVYRRARYDTVFARAEALGLRFVGPEYPNGHQADPWPSELPTRSLCVPTFHHAGRLRRQPLDNSTSCSRPPALPIGSRYAR